MSNEEKKPEGALAEVVKNWRSSCLEKDPTKTEKDLQADARIFFRYLSRSTSIVTEGNVKLETRSSHEEALAKLIQELGPAFTAEHHQSRVRGLCVLAGAISGCSDASISNKTTTLLGTFLIGHCGPIDDDEYGEDYDSMIRDAALSALGALTQTGGESNEGLLEALTIRLQLSRQGIERRCAAPDGGEAEIDPYGSHGRMQDIRGGLSSLTRSKRSICFSTIQNAISGVATLTRQAQPIGDNIIDKAQPHLVEYAKFASNCIHGESDPRCLLQLLQILHQMQMAFAPWFQSSKTADKAFPADSLFDAVSPYYPIQFTPPPNDIHGITRENLHLALISVLNFTKLDKDLMSHNQHSMLCMSIGLYLEQITPIPGEESASTVEKQEALDCISAILFPENNESLCALLDVPTTRNLAAALESVHTESSLAVASGGPAQRDNNKRLADDCRNLLSRIAFDLEIAPNRSLFDTFVAEPLSKQSQKIKLSPSYSKTSIAYIACLAASGRSRTLRLCLSTGLETLLVYLSEGHTDEEDIATAAHGTGAFFSSCRVAMERAKEKGVALHPHPLEPYTERALKLLLDIFEDDKQSLIVKIGVVRALESLFISCPKIDIQPDEVSRICHFIDRLSAVVVDGSSETDDELGADWRSACGLSLGSIVGTSLSLENEQEAGETALPFLSISTINESIRNKVYPALLDSAQSNKINNQPDRFDRSALATACKSNRVTANSVVSLLLERLCAEAEKDLCVPLCIVTSETLSYLFRNGGEQCLRAYHDNESSNVLLTIIGKQSRNHGKTQLRSSVANLALPNTKDEEVKLKSELDVIFIIVNNLLPAYEQFVPQQRLESLLSAVSNILPPLSEDDSFGLYTRLPILSAILRGCATGGHELGASLEDATVELLPSMTEFVLGNDYDPRARSAAASCIQAIITLLPPGRECPVKPLVTKSIAPIMSPATDTSGLLDAIQMLSILGSAAACRACSSSPTAAEISRFLVDLACTSKASSMFSSGDDVDFSNWNTDDKGNKFLETAAASAYGAILSTKLRSVVRQRLTRVGLEFVRAEYKLESKQAISGKKIVAPRAGLLTIACHVICCSNITKMDKTDLHQLATLILEGLGSCDSLPSQTKILTLTSVLKLISIAPSTVSGMLLTVVSGLLRAYAVSSPASEVASKLLALQALERMASIEGARSSAPNIKPAVVSILSLTLNHPSGLLRQAAVDVQNAWHVL